MTSEPPSSSGVRGLHRALSLDAERRVRDGSAGALAAAIRRGADLHIGTEFRHNEHVDTSSDNPETVRELAEFRTTYLVEDRWTAGIMTLRQPVSLPDAFGPRPSMSFFLYNQDGTQAIARPHLDGAPNAGATGAAPIDSHPDMPRYHQLDSWDADTNAPSSNFIYDFEHFDFFVRDDWTEVLAHDADGAVVQGRWMPWARLCAAGGEIKAAIRGLCADLAAPGAAACEHEVFVQIGSSYYYTAAAALHWRHTPAAQSPGIDPAALCDPSVGRWLVAAAHRWPRDSPPVRSILVAFHVTANRAMPSAGSRGGEAPVSAFGTGIAAPLSRCPYARAGSGAFGTAAADSGFRLTPSPEQLSVAGRDRRHRRCSCQCKGTIPEPPLRRGRAGHVSASYRHQRLRRPAHRLSCSGTRTPSTRLRSS